MTNQEKIEELEAQIAEQGFIIQQTQIDRDTWRSKYHEVADENGKLKAALERRGELVFGREGD